MGYFFVLSYLICFGLSDCLWLFIKKDIPLSFVMLLRSIITTTLFLFLFLLVKFNFINIGFKIYPCSFLQISEAVLLSIVSYWGLYFFVKSLNYNGVGLSATITTVTNSVLSLILSILFFKELLTFKISICFILAFIGILLCDKNSFQNSLKFKFTKGVGYCFLAAIFWAVSYTLFKNPIEKIGVINFSLILESSILLMGLIIFFVKKQTILIAKQISIKEKKIIAFIGFLIFVGTLTNSASYNVLPLITLNILGKLGLTVPVLFGMILLKERPSTKQYLGIGILFLASIILIIN